MCIERMINRMISVSEYHTEYDKVEQVSYVHPDEALNCPFCACAELIRKGWRRRKLFILIGTFIVLMIRRVKCKKCRRIHHVLPSTIVPYKRYDAETIENIIEGNSDETCCEESAINRIKAWWTELCIYILMIAPVIMEKRQVQVKPESKLTEIVRILANAHLWPGTRSVLVPG